MPLLILSKFIHTYVIFHNESIEMLKRLQFSWELAVVICADVAFITSACRVSISTCRECHCFLASANSARASLRAALPRLTCAHAASSWVRRHGSDIDEKHTHTQTHTLWFFFIGTQRRSSARWSCW